MVCPKFDFCEKAKKHEEELDIDYLKLFCKASKYEECEKLFEE